MPELTRGSLLRGLLRLAGPMFVSALLHNAQSVIDLFWVGRLGSDSVAALALSGTVLMMLFPLIMGMATGTVAIVSRRVGEGAPEAAADAAGESLLLALLLGLGCGAVGWAVIAQLDSLLGAPPGVSRLAGMYLQVSLLGSCVMFMLFIGNSVLQAAGNTVIPMCVMVLANVVNILLDPVLIFGWGGLPRLGVRGAALATVLSHAVACSVMLYLLIGGRTRIHIHLRRWRLTWRGAWELLRIGAPSSGQMLSRSLMALVLMSIVAGCGTAAMAAYGIGLRFHMLALMPAFALGNATATLVGQNLGARQPRRAETAGWLGAAAGVAVMLTAATLLMTWSPALIRIFDDSPAVIDVGTSYIRITSLFFLFAGLAIVLGRALQGAGDTIPPMVITIISLWGVQVPLALLLSRWLEPATRGIWWAIAAAMTLHGVLVTVWFVRGRWKTKRV